MTLYDQAHPVWTAEAGGVPITLPKSGLGCIHLFDRLHDLELSQLCSLAVGLGFVPPPPGVPREAIEYAVAALLQVRWNKDVKGRVPQSVDSSCATYSAQYKKIVEAVNRGETIMAKSKTDKVKKTPKVYVITRYNVTAKDGAKLLAKDNKSHNAVLYRAIAEAKEPPTTEEIFAAVDKREYSSSAKDSTVNMRWHLQDLRNKGFIKSADKKEEQEAA